MLMISGSLDIPNKSIHCILVFDVKHEFNKKITHSNAI